MNDRRQQLIIQLLRLAADPHQLGAALEGIPGTGTALPIRPHEPHCHLTTHGHCTCWLTSLDETHRCLRTMRHTQRPLWYAIHERYVAATRKPTLIQVRRGRPILEPHQTALSLISRTDLDRHGNGTTRILIETWRPGLNPDRITAGLTWLTDNFHGNPQLPLDLLHAA